MPAFNFRYIVTLASLAFTPTIHASSFDCTSASNSAEKAICADAYTSSLDEKLDKLWKNTLPKVSDPQALKTDQREWLKQRNRCAEDLSCLRRQYLMRMKALEYVAKPFTWNATWRMIPWGTSTAGEVTTTLQDATHITFDISAANGGNSGDMNGVAVLEDSVAHYDSGGCTLKFSPSSGLWDIEQDGGEGACGGGMGVYYAGRYVASEQPVAVDYDLLSLGVLRTAQEDQAMRTLLKGDYQTLLANSGAMTESEASTDVPEGSVQEFWVRGLASSNAAILMRASDDRLWLVLLVFDDQRRVRARYYTNVPDWKKRVPDVLAAWHVRMTHDEPLPLDLMP